MQLAATCYTDTNIAQFWCLMDMRIVIQNNYVIIQSGYVFIPAGLINHFGGQKCIDQVIATIMYCTTINHDAIKNVIIDHDS